MSVCLAGYMMMYLRVMDEVSPTVLQVNNNNNNKERWFFWLTQLHQSLCLILLSLWCVRSCFGDSSYPLLCVCVCVCVCV